MPSTGRRYPIKGYKGVPKKQKALKALPFGPQLLLRLALLLSARQLGGVMWEQKARISLHMDIMLKKHKKFVLQCNHR
jgi:hypothetical protein